MSTSIDVPRQEFMHSRSRKVQSTKTVAALITLVTCAILLSLARLHYDSSTDTAHGPFTLARTVETSTSLSFAALGDTGTGTESQRSVASALADVAHRLPVEFVLLLGDQFYPSGVRDVHDPQWSEKFERMYRHDALPVPFFPVLGNHEYDGDPEAFISYSARSSRWRATSRYYTFLVALPGGGTAQFFGLDTYALGRWYRRLDGQLSWLEESLKNSTADWKIVFGHHPVASSGKHAEAKTTHELHDSLLPLFEKYNVQLYLSGHDHNLQVLRVQPNLFQVISGGGGAPLHPVNPRPESLLAVSHLGFVLINVNSGLSQRPLELMSEWCPYS